MIRSAKALAGAAALVMMGGSMAAAATTGTGGVTAPGAGAEQCTIRVDRSGAANSYDVTRQVNQAGKCTCFVRTGPDSQDGNAEALLAALRASRDCSGAPAAIGVVAGAGALLSTTGGIIAGTAIAAGATVGAVAANGNDSP